MCLDNVRLKSISFQDTVVAVYQCTIINLMVSLGGMETILCSIVQIVLEF